MNSDISIPTFSDRDLYQNSSDNILLVIPKSRSKNYKLAIELAAKVTSRQVIVDEKLFTLCSINPSVLRDCEIACEILNVAGGWKGFTHIYKGRTLGNSWATSMVLSCIMDATRCNNPLANCLCHLRESEFLKKPTYTDMDNVGFTITAPCKKAAYRFYDPLIPVSPEDQYQAFSVEKDVYWCPFFKMENFSMVTKKAKSKIKNKRNQLHPFMLKK
ncbi:hypothetical protein [Morganella morganii]|uniref:hypothetical protein n=1 Tax=Morganella morganii TaxID=582 RepID=UPI00052DAEC1|nr:hypothetical protein [Morganella morganii]KGP42284.1 hypothetical protein LR61_19280 [Morganella morganii]